MYFVVNPYVLDNTSRLHIDENRNKRIESRTELGNFYDGTVDKDYKLQGLNDKSYCPQPPQPKLSVLWGLTRLRLQCHLQLSRDTILYLSSKRCTSQALATTTRVIYTANTTKSTRYSCTTENPKTLSLLHSRKVVIIFIKGEPIILGPESSKL